MRISEKFRIVTSSVYLALINQVPGPLGFLLRHRFWKKRLKHLGRGTLIDVGVHFQHPELISIGENTWLDRNVLILAGMDESCREKVTVRNKEYSGAGGEVHVGSRVHVGPGCIISGISSGVHIGDECGFSAGCKVYSFIHHYRSRKNPGNRRVTFGPMVEAERQTMIEGPVNIGQNTGVALNSVILPGVAIRENSFVSINSVVMPGSKFSPNTIIGGNPAQPLGNRFEDGGS